LLQTVKQRSLIYNTKDREIVKRVTVVL
jgi:hypothetical protein